MRNILLLISGFNISDDNLSLNINIDEEENLL